MLNSQARSFFLIERRAKETCLPIRKNAIPSALIESTSTSQSFPLERNKGFVYIISFSWGSMSISSFGFYRLWENPIGSFSKRPIEKAFKVNQKPHVLCIIYNTDDLIQLTHFLSSHGRTDENESRTRTFPRRLE